jgi:hypothetical protein
VFAPSTDMSAHIQEVVQLRLYPRRVWPCAAQEGRPISAMGMDGDGNAQSLASEIAGQPHAAVAINPLLQSLQSRPENAV